MSEVRAHPGASRSPMSAEQFFDWATRQEQRWELVEGEAVMQAGATRDHERVAKRIFASLLRQVDEKILDVNKGDFGVRIRRGRGAGTILYPDVVVDRQSGTGDERATMTPIVVIEVLSASTDFDHHVKKFGLYKRRESLRHYAVFEQKRPAAYVWTFGSTGWPDKPAIIEESDRQVSLAAIQATIDLREVYRTL